MEFCKLCDNMLYIKREVTDEQDKLINYCKNCSNSVELKSGNKSILIFENNYEKEKINYKLFVNPYIKYDPTLPRVNNLVCPNAKCTKKKNQDNEVIYIKYDNENMKYLYYCVYCEEFWVNKK
jgi:DNA-directed RNA polymerase subunit M/transcription elongation factor TFIIS